MNDDNLGQDNNGGAQYVTFMLGDEIYGLGVARVEEIIGYQDVTPVPNQPPYMTGIIDLRGAVVPIIDLRLRFGLKAKEHDRYTVIIIVSAHKGTAGIIVDAVSDVVTLPDDRRQPPPQFAGGKAHPEFIDEVGRDGDDFLVLLDVNGVIDAEVIGRAQTEE